MPQSAQFGTVNIPSYSAFKEQTWPEFVLILLCTKQALCIEACQLPVSYITPSHPFLTTCELCEMKQIHNLIVSFDYVGLSESFIWWDCTWKGKRTWDAKRHKFSICTYLDLTTCLRKLRMMTMKSCTYHEDKRKDRLWKKFKYRGFWKIWV